MQQVQRVEFTVWAIVKVFAVVFALYLIWQILDILALIFVTFILVAALNPLVKWLSEYGVPRTGGVILIYIVLFTLLAGLFSLIFPPLVEQVRLLAQSFPALVHSVTPLSELLLESNTQNVLQGISSQLSGFTQSVFSATATIFGGALSALTVFILSFYMLVEEQKARHALVPLIPGELVKPVLATINRVSDKLGSWMRGQLVLSGVIGLISYIGLLILGVPYALTLAAIAGIAEIIPVVGPIAAGLAAVVVAYASSSWEVAVAVFVFYVILQQLENNILVPKIMESAVGLSPIIVIIALAVGSKLAGVTGAVLAVPIAATVAVLVQEWPRLVAARK